MLQYDPRYKYAIVVKNSKVFSVLFFEVLSEVTQAFRNALNYDLATIITLFSLGTTGPQVILYQHEILDLEIEIAKFDIRSMS